MTGTIAKCDEGACISVQLRPQVLAHSNMS